MRDTSENRTVHADAERLRARISAAAKSLLRSAVTGLLLYTQATAAPLLHYGTRSLPIDPLFNLPYDPSQVHFESISISSVGECAPVLGSLGHDGRPVRLFGQLRSSGARVLILGNEDPRAPRGLSGTVLVMRGGNCRTSGPLLALRRTPVGDPELDPGLSPNDVANLLNDVFARYAQAFGGKTAFLGWADRLTHEAEEAQREQPDMPCPLLYTRLFTPPMMNVLNAFRAS
jgi:hypothetical protein